MRVLVQQAAFDPGVETGSFLSGRRDVGAVVTFTGLVRDVPGGGLEALEIEHYPGMTEAAIGDIAQRAVDRWSLSDVLVIHRHGRLSLGEIIMMVATAAPHRRDAFEAAMFLMDYLKSRAPFWKREHGPQGSTWVEATAQDEAALAQWGR